MARAKKAKPKTKRASAKTKRVARPRRSSGTVVLVATRKGAWIFRGDAGRKTWQIGRAHV